MSHSKTTNLGNASKAIQLETHQRRRSRSLSTDMRSIHMRAHQRIWAKGACEGNKTQNLNNVPGVVGAGVVGVGVVSAVVDHEATPGSIGHSSDAMEKGGGARDNRKQRKGCRNCHFSGTISRDGARVRLQNKGITGCSSHRPHL